ncbi:MAG: hypothetical protein U0271_45830 [Polyangiaceae bacterium]
MNLSAATIVLRPRKTSEVMDLTFRVAFSIALGPYVRIALATLLPAYVALLALKYLLAIPWPMLWLIAIPLSTWLEGPFTVSASRLVFGERLTVRQTLATFGKRIPSYTGALLLRVLLVALGLMVCVGVFFILPAALLMGEISLLENAAPLDAFKRSRVLASQRASNASLAGMAMSIAKLGFVFGLEALGHGIVRDVLQLGEPFGSLISDYGSPYALLGLLLSGPFMATGRFLHYIDARTRADGWDIQVRYMALLAEDAKP